MTPREHAEELRRAKAIMELLAERDAIDAQLKSLGYGQEIKTAPSERRRGRPPKDKTTVRESRTDIRWSRYDSVGFVGNASAIRFQHVAASCPPGFFTS